MLLLNIPFLSCMIDRKARHARIVGTRVDADEGRGPLWASFSPPDPNVANTVVQGTLIHRTRDAHKGPRSMPHRPRPYNDNGHLLQAKFIAEKRSRYGITISERYGRGCAHPHPG